MERNRYEKIRLAFLSKGIYLKRIQDGGFLKNGKMISAQRGVDFFGFDIVTGVHCEAEAKESSEVVFSSKLLKSLEPSQIMRLTLITNLSQNIEGYVATYSPEDQKVRAWKWRNRKIGDEPFFEVGTKAKRNA